MPTEHEAGQMDEHALRQSIIDHCLAMNASGLNQGTSGNISVRRGDVMLITPSGIPYDQTTPEMIAAMPLDGGGAWAGPKKPSSEWHFHLDIMRARPDVGAIVHTHSLFATSLAIARKPIPPCHYMIASFGGGDVRVADYARYGTQALSENVLRAMEGRTACLMANHGMIATGPDLRRAMAAAVELENVAHQYFNALQIGGPVLLDEAELAEVLEGFKTYGKQD